MRHKKLSCCAFVLAVLLTASTTFAATTSLFSPDKKVEIQFSCEKNSPQWSVNYNGEKMLNPSALGLVIGAESGTPSYEVVQKKETSKDSTWKPIYEAAEIRNNYNELQVELKQTQGSTQLVLFLRAYNDGVALRYVVVPEDKEAKTCVIAADLTEFRFAKEGTTWSYAGERTPTGPRALSKCAKTTAIPLTIKFADNCYAAVLEAALYNIAPFNLRQKEAGSTNFQVNISKSNKKAPFETPWRVLSLATSAGGLIESKILPNLNPPCKIADTSWIVPGKAFWDWRCMGAKTKDGFTYGRDMKSWKRLIDFAGKNNIQYLLIDADWYGPEFKVTSDPKTCIPGANMPELIKYAKERNVGIFLYFNHQGTKNFDFDETLATYHKWGAAGLKYGFLRGYSGQAKVDVTREIVEKCAKHKLMVDFHDGPIPPSGDRRTWPNLITKEYCHAQSDAKRAFDPTCFVTTVYVNMLAGPLDMTNGLYDLNKAEKERSKVFAEVYSTVAGENARVFIVLTGLNVLHDHGDAYAAKADLFEFLREMPSKWDETRVLGGEVGQYITLARRAGDAWFLGSSTNEEARELTYKLDFLKDGVTYDCTLYEDAKDTHYKTNREAYAVRKISVKNGTP